MTDDSTNVFGFMSLRPIRQPEAGAYREGLIRDDTIHPADPTASTGSPARGRREDVDLFSTSSPSRVSKTVFRGVSRGQSPRTIALQAERILLSGYQGTIGASAAFSPVLRRASVTSAHGAMLTDLSARPHYIRDGQVYILPATLDDMETPLAFPLARLRDELRRAFARIAEARASQRPASASGMLSSTHEAAVAYPPLIDLVYSRTSGAFAQDFAIAKRACFDAFYGLYVLRRLYPVRLEPVIEALQTLHALERFALYLFVGYLHDSRGDSAAQQDVALLATTLAHIHPELFAGGASWEEIDESLEATGLPVGAGDAADEGPFAAQPMIHPIFQRLSKDLRPFNELKPVGIGDLMVVKQKFLGYRKGEIAHIETVLAGETKATVHRRLDRSEVSQTYTSSDESESSTDRQSTTRYELKREAEAVLKADFGTTLGATLTYDNKMVVSSVTASANLALSRSDTTRLATNFARDVTEKAVTKVQRKVSEQRSRTVVAETEVTNTHSFTNVPANGHISGIYRWVDKVYQAEIRNYGRRLMFELIVPEPAAFFAQQRLLEYVAKLALPKYPKKEIPTANDGSHTPPVANASQITRDRFVELNQTYMLDDLMPPIERIDGIPVSDATGGRTFTMTSPYDDTRLKSDQYFGCRLADYPQGYEFVAFAVQGALQFAGKGETEPNWQNTLRVRVDNRSVFEVVDESLVFWNWSDPVVQGLSAPLSVPIAAITIETKTCKSYNLTISASAQLTSAAFAAWQQRVYDHLVTSRLRPVNAGTPVEDPDVVAFRDALKEITKPDVRQLLQGRSSEWNAQVVRRELRRQCISQVTKEFANDSRSLDVTNVDAMGRLGVASGYTFPDLTVTPGNPTAVETTAALEPRVFPTPGYAVPDVDISRRKGNHIQFIEHAFEWEQLSYVFYPYYWTPPPRWVELLSREDDTDPFFTDFLQAGAARVLLAVRPGFESSVMHYLATREPWEGGSAPVIGDPLHVPVHMEIRGRQDDYGRSERVGDPWVVSVPTSLVYLESEKDSLPNEYDPDEPLT